MWYGLQSSNGLKYFTQYMYEGISEIDNPEEIYIEGLGECKDAHVKIGNYFVFTTPHVLSLAGDSIVELSIGDKVEMSATSLMYCPNLKKINILSGWQKEDSVQCNCLVQNKIVSVTFPNSQLPTDGSATAIGRRGLSGFWERKEISIPEGYVRIGSEAFYECAKLEKIILPKSLQTISETAFNYCKNLKEIIFNGSDKEWFSLMGNNNIKLDKTVLVKFLVE